MPRALAARAAETRIFGADGSAGASCLCRAKRPVAFPRATALSTRPLAASAGMADPRFPATGDGAYMKLLKGDTWFLRNTYVQRYKKLYFDTGSFRPVLHIIIGVGLIGYGLEYWQHGQCACPHTPERRARVVSPRLISVRNTALTSVAPAVLLTRAGLVAPPRADETHAYKEKKARERFEAGESPSAKH